MAYLSTKHVPRESYGARFTRWLGWFSPKTPKTKSKAEEKPFKVPNNRMVPLTPHILRDIGVCDGKGSKRSR
jgi:hypothetical protein